MELAIPERGCCTLAAFATEFRCSFNEFRRFRQSLGVDAGGPVVALVDLFPRENAVLRVLLRHRVVSRRGRVGLEVELYWVRNLPEEVNTRGQHIESSQFWARLSELAPATVLVDADVCLHFPSGTFSLKGLQLEGLGAQVSGDKPVVLTDGISLRFSGFPNGLEQMRLYAVGPFSAEKCLQVDVRHSFQTALSEDILGRIVQMGRTAVGTFVDLRGTEE